METVTRTPFIVACAVGAVVAAARNIDVETIGVAVTLTGLLGMLIGLVWWDTWPAEPSRTAGASGQPDPQGSDDRLAGPALSPRALH